MLILREPPVHVLLASPARQIRVVDGRRDADARRGLAVQVAQIVGEVFEIAPGVVAHLREDFVQQDEVVGRACGPRDGGVRLEIKVPVAFLGDSFVDELFWDSQPLFFFFFTFVGFYGIQVSCSECALTVPKVGLLFLPSRICPFAVVR